MNQQTLRDELRNLFEETFEVHHGIYTDKATSLLETLGQIDHPLASRVLPGLGESIAGHVFHTSFYVRVLLEYIRGVRTGKTDWSESWVVREVSDAEWRKLIVDLGRDYRALLDFQTEVEDWSAGENLGGVLAILVHCAYHLGAIRQMKDVALPLLEGHGGVERLDP